MVDECLSSIQCCQLSCLINTSCHGRLPIKLLAFIPFLSCFQIYFKIILDRPSPNGTLGQTEKRNARRKTQCEQKHYITVLIHCKCHERVSDFILLTTCSSGSDAGEHENSSFQQNYLFIQTFCVVTCPCKLDCK